jgi:hypothetical protein
LLSEDEPKSEPGNSRRKLYTALACYGVIAVLAGITLDGKFRLVVWVFLAYLAARTYLHALRKP